MARTETSPGVAGWRAQILGCRGSGLLVAAAVVLGQTGQNVTLPIFADTIGAAGGTPYFVVWFASLCFVILFGIALVVQHLCIGNHGSSAPSMFTASFQKGPMLIGFCNALNGMMLVFASPSSRTPPYLQASLGNFTIPLTIALRAALVGNTPTLGQVCAALSVLFGLFVSLVPNIFGRDESDPVTSDAIFWPLWFMTGFLPLVLMNVIEEKVLKHEHRNTSVVAFVFTLNFWQLVSVTALFWLDMVPGYGMSSGLYDWAHHMQDGLWCFLFADACGGVAFFWGSLFVLCYMLAYVASAVLLKHTEGAVWQAVVTSMVGPLGTTWWSIFQPQPNFHVAPAWGDKMTFAALGLAVMLPGIVLYHMKGKTEMHRPKDNIAQGLLADVMSETL